MYILKPPVQAVPYNLPIAFLIIAHFIQVIASIIIKLLKLFHGSTVEGNFWFVKGVLLKNRYSPTIQTGLPLTTTGFNSKSWCGKSNDISFIFIKRMAWNYSIPIAEAEPLLW